MSLPPLPRTDTAELSSRSSSYEESSEEDDSSAQREPNTASRKTTILFIFVVGILLAVLLVSLLVRSSSDSRGFFPPQTTPTPTTTTPAYWWCRGLFSTLRNEDARLTASDTSAGDSFGYSVAISGDTVIVGVLGAELESGSSYIFVRGNGTTAWTQQAKLKASDAAVGNHFGQAVALSGDTALVTAYRNSTFGIKKRVYVFGRSGTTWTETAIWTGSLYDGFGDSVALSDDIAIVGAFMWVNLYRIRFVLIFVRTDTAWTERGILTASDAVVDSVDRRFGHSVAISGNTIIVGAPGDDPAGSGSAYIFVHTTGTTTWAAEQAKLTASDAASGTNFGWSVAISGDTAIVGAPEDDDHTRQGYRTSSGSAYIFVRTNTTWTQQAKLTASDAFELDQFGFSVSISGDTAIVGASGNDCDEAFNSGSAYIFVRTNTTWTEKAQLVASDAEAYDAFGRSVSISGDTAVVGTGSSSEKAYIFYTPP